MSNTPMNKKSLEALVTAVFVAGANASARFGFDNPEYAECKKEIVASALGQLRSRPKEICAAATRPLSNMITIGDGVLVCAFRYALGRRTYVVSEVCDAIKQNATKIQPKLRDLMMEEISEAINTDRAGDDMDVRLWRECQEALQQSPQPSMENVANTRRRKPIRKRMI